MWFIFWKSSWDLEIYICRTDCSTVAKCHALLIDLTRVIVKHATKADLAVFYETGFKYEELTLFQCIHLSPHNQYRHKVTMHIIRVQIWDMFKLVFLVLNVLKRLCHFTKSGKNENKWGRIHLTKILELLTWICDSLELFAYIIGVNRLISGPTI